MNPIKLNLIRGAFCALISTTLLHAADWPQWQGAARDNISTETGLLKQWPAEGPKLAWKTPGLGGGFSGVSVSLGRIYTMGDAADACYLRALDAATGKILWSTKVGEPKGGSGHPGPRCTPTVDGTQIFALGQFGDLICVEAAAGRVRWRKNMLTDFQGMMAKTNWGYAESPLVDGNQLIVTPGGPSGTMAALDKNTGAVIWRTKEWTDNAFYVSSLFATIGGVRQIVQLTDQHVGGVDPATGKMLWLAVREGRTAIVTTPVVDGNLVFVTSGYGVGCHCFQVDHVAGKFTAKELYAKKEMDNQHGGVAKVGANIYGYADKAGWTCLEMSTGRVLWADKSKLGKGSLSCADGMLYLRLENGPGTVVLIDASPAGWQEKGRFDQPDRSKPNSWPHPVIANGRLYLRDQDTLLCYDVKGTGTAGLSGPAAPVAAVKPVAAQPVAAPAVRGARVAEGRPGARRAITIKGVAVGLRWCPPGKFMIGSPASEPERTKDEAQHQVTLTQGFWLMETEVTQALWAAVAGKIEAKFKGPDQPAEPVTWYDAVDFCNQLSAASGLRPAYTINKQVKDPNNQSEEKNDPVRWQVTLVPDANGFRLPTEAQWEYACRAGTGTVFSWGDAIDPGMANYNGNNVYNNGGKGVYLEKTTPVGKYAPNPWGLSDMHGNVWEWCWDWYGPYAEGNVTDPTGATSGSLRVLRGGVWHYKPGYLRSASRYKDKPARRWDLLGLRPIVPDSNPNNTLK